MTQKTFPKVYCSGPLFSPEEVGAMQAIADTLEDHGMRVPVSPGSGLSRQVLDRILEVVEKVQP